MLSSRGQAFANSCLYGEYGRDKKEQYDKITNPEGDISFLNAENFLMHDELLEYINHNFSFTKDLLSYNEGPIGTLRLRNAMASHLNAWFSPFTAVTIEQVTFTPGVTGLNEMFAYNITDEEEGILLGGPIYGSFHTDLVTKSKSVTPEASPIKQSSNGAFLSQNRCRLVYAEFGDVDQFSRDCVAKYEEAWEKAEQGGVKVKALLICNPHNPLGKCYSKATLMALMDFCEIHGLHLVSDEIYALSVFEVDGRKVDKFVSALSIDPRGLIRTDKIHVLYGMSKDFGAAGLRLGCLISQNKEMTKATRAISRFHWPSEVSGAVAAMILEDQAFVTSYIQKSRERLAEAHAFATKILDQAGIDYFHNGNAGFFLWLNLSPYISANTPNTMGWGAEKKLQKQFADAGVHMSTGALYRAENPGYFRVIFTLQRDVLEEGLRRITAVIGAIKH